MVADQGAYLEGAEPQNGRHKMPLVERPQPEAFCDVWKALKCGFGRGSVPDPARGAQDAPSDPLVG